MKLTGTIKRSDLEGGHWLFQADGGDQYRLEGKTDGLHDGLRAEVEGKIEKHEMGFAMTGPHFHVHKVTKL